MCNGFEELDLNDQLERVREQIVKRTSIIEINKPKVVSFLAHGGNI